MGAAYLYLNTKRPAGPSGFGVRHTTEDVSVGVDLRGKVALVTGPTSGIGFETAFALALRGAHVVLAARNPKKLAETIAALERRLSLRGVSAHLTALQLDLSSLASVRAATDAFYGLGLSLDILVLNAGVMVLKRRQATADGFEMQVRTGEWCALSLRPSTSASPAGRLEPPGPLRAGNCSAARPARRLSLSRRRPLVRGLPSRQARRLPRAASARDRSLRRAWPGGGERCTVAATRTRREIGIPSAH